MNHLIPDSEYLPIVWFLKYIPDTPETSVILFTTMLLIVCIMILSLGYTHKQLVRYTILGLITTFLVLLGTLLELRDYAFKNPIKHIEKTEYINQYNNISCVDEFKIKRDCIIIVTTTSVSYPFGFGGKSSANETTEIIEVE